MVRSFFEAPRIVYANRACGRPGPPEIRSRRAHAHKVLHGGDGLKSPHATGGETGGSPEGGSSAAGMESAGCAARVRDFECSFFAGALLVAESPVPALSPGERHRVEAGVKSSSHPRFSFAGV